MAESRLQKRYESEIAPALLEYFHYSNVMQVPKVHKIVVNMGVGEAAIQGHEKVIEYAVRDMTEITGQKPVVTIAKRSVASFKLREGRNVGCMVTLRGQRMYDFLDKLINVVLPRVRDFQGISANAFDGRGNYSLGLREQIIFPEIEYDKIDKVRGLEITIVTTARTDEEGLQLLRLLGMPFRKK